MPGIAISPWELLIIGIPQGFLFVWALYIYTRTRFDTFKYICQSLIFIVVTYASRLLPINVGVHTVLSLLALILLFLIFNKVSLQVLINTITSAIVVAIITTFAEVANGLLVDWIQGPGEAAALFNSGNPRTTSLSQIPSNIIIAIILVISYFVMKKIGKHGRRTNGENSEKTGT